MLPIHNVFIELVFDSSTLDGSSSGSHPNLYSESERRSKRDSEYGRRPHEMVTW